MRTWGRKSRQWWRLKSCKTTKDSRLQHLQGEPRQGRDSGQFLCAPPRFWPRLRPKPQKMFLRSTPKKWNNGTPMRKESRATKDKIDQWIAKTKETCLFCAEPLLVRKTQKLSEGPMPHHRTDVLLLADVSENFTRKSLHEYIMAESGAILQLAGLELRRSSEKDGEWNLSSWEIKTSTFS